MRRLLVGLCLAVCGASVCSARDSYRVTVTRKEANMYRVDGTKTYIQTKYCYEYVYSESAILNYARGGINNKLIFDKRPMVTSCDVEKLLTED